jgi:hypothetical protein
MRKPYRILLAGAAVMGMLLAAASTVSSAPAKALAAHPENPHYLIFRGQPVVLISSGEHYGAVLNLDFDYRPYLDELRSHRLNHTRLFSGTYREVSSSFGITENTLAPKPNRYLAPWARSGTPGYFDGGNKFDLTRWDEDYFRRLKDFIRQAGRRDIVVEISLFCPLYDEGLWRANPMNATNNINSVGQCALGEVYALKHPDLTGVQKAVVRKIVQELNSLDNLYYEVCNEPWLGNVTSAWQHEMISTIVEAESALPERHLISLNAWNVRITEPHPAVAIYNFHRADVAQVVAQNYGLNRLIGDNETGFRGRANRAYRTEAWDCILSGGGLFSSLDYSFTPSHPDGSLTEYKSPGGGNKEFRKELAVLKDFIHGFQFVRMAPDASIVTGPLPPALAAPRVLAEPGRAYAIYLRRRTDVDKFSVRWTGSITPRTSEALNLHMLSKNGFQLWVDDKLVLENPRDHKEKEETVSIKVQAGRPLGVRVESYNLGNGSVSRLLWSATGLEKEVIPAAGLSEADGTRGGLTGEYFHDRKMTRPIFSRQDARVNFDWSKDAAFANATDQPFKLKLNLPAAHYRAEWLNPISGKNVAAEKFTHAGGEMVLSVPGFTDDIALKIDRQN